MTNEDGRQEKRPYQTPKITVISLRPEEAVLGNCKSMTHTGPALSACTNVGPCNQVGS